MTTKRTRKNAKPVVVNSEAIVINREAPERQSEATVAANIAALAVVAADPNVPICDTFGHFKEGADACTECSNAFTARHAACLKMAMGGNVKRRSKNGGATASGKLGKYSTFAELRSQLSDPHGILNRKMDKLTLDGATLAELLEIGKDGGKGMFKNLSMIKAHLKYRAAGGWVYKVEAGKVTLVDYKPKADLSRVTTEALKSIGEAAPVVEEEKVEKAA